MGLFSRKSSSSTSRGTKSVSARSFGTWRWYDDDSSWHLSINNRLSAHIRMTLIDFTSRISEIAPSEDFPKLPTPGKRIRVSGMQGFGDDYRWFVTIHGLDGRRYFFEKVDNIVGKHLGFATAPRPHSEIDTIPFETDDELPDSPTHPPQAHVNEPDEEGASERPTVSLSDENAAAVLSLLADFTESTYDELCFYLFGGAKPWQEKVLNELKRRHDLGSLDADELNAAIRKRRAEIDRSNADKTRQMAAIIEAQLQKARGYGFDPPGGWGAVGPG